MQEKFARKFSVFEPSGTTRPIFSTFIAACMYCITPLIPNITYSHEAESILSGTENIADEITTEKFESEQLPPLETEAKEPVVIMNADADQEGSEPQQENSAIQEAPISSSEPLETITEKMPEISIPLAIISKALEPIQAESSDSISKEINSRNVITVEVTNPEEQAPTRVSSIDTPAIQSIIKNSAITTQMGISVNAKPASAEDVQFDEPPNKAKLSFDDLLSMTLQNHPTVLGKREDSKSASYELDVAKSAFYPSPSVQFQQNSSAANGVVTLQQPLWTGGRLTATKRAAESRLNSSRAAITEVQLALALKLATTYQTILQSVGKKEVLKRGITLLESYNERIKRRIEGGASAEVETELVKARIAQSKSDLRLALQSEKNSLVQLSQLTGQSIQSTSALNLSSTPRQFEIDNLISSIQTATAYSPGIKRLTADIAAAEQDINTKRSAYLPSVNLRAGHTKNNTASALFNAPYSQSQVLVLMEYTPGPGKSAFEAVDSSKAKLQSVLQSLETAKRELSEKVSQEHEEYIANTERKSELESTLEASNQVLASYNRLFIAGKRSWLDVINAARECIQVETQLNDVNMQIIGAGIRLQLLTGKK